MTATPTVVGERIFFGACNGIFYALDTSSAKVLWKYDITQDGSQRSFHVNPAADGEVIYVGCDYGQYFKNKSGVGHLYSFDLKSGAVRWKYKVPLGIGSDPVFDERHVLAITVEDELLSLNKKSGRLDWSLKRPGQVRHLFPKAAPLLEGERLYLGSGNGHFYTLDKKTGRIIRDIALDGGVYVTPTAAGDSYYVITRNRTLYQLSKRDSSVQRSAALPIGPALAPLFDQNSVFIQGGRLAYALDRTTLSLKWRADLGTYMAGRFPVLYGDCLIVATQDGSLRCLSRENGSHSWEYRVGAEITGGIARSGNVIYATTRTGSLYAIALE